MFRNHLSIWLFGVWACFITDSAARKAIVGGNRATIGHFKYQVSLQDNGQHFCGGGIIGKNIILTSAYCIIEEHSLQILYHNLTVLVGTNDLRKRSEPALTRQVRKIYTPTEFDPTSRAHSTIADIAILELDDDLSPLRCHGYFQSLRVPVNKRDTYENKTAVIAGFGWNWINIINDQEIFGGTNNTRLQWAEARVLPPSDPLCSRTVAIHSKNKICGRIEQREHETRGVCHRDAGGPLVLDGTTVIGVLSTGPLSCSEKIFGATYTRVTEYLRFIRNVKENKIKKNIREYVVSKQPSAAGPSQAISS